MDHPINQALPNVPDRQQRTNVVEHRLTSSWANIAGLAILIPFLLLGLAFLLFALQPILTVVLAMLVLPVAIPLFLFLYVWYDLRDRPLNWPARR
jgi:hypothetical protein